MHEAWGEIRISEAIRLKAGRQEIIYDNSRIFGNVDWAQQGRSHDAAIIKWLPRDDMTTFSQTTGLRAVYNTGSSSLSGSAFLQTGRDARNRRLTAHYLAVEYSRPLSEHLVFSSGFELLSGTDQTDMADPGYDRNHSFTPLYGTNHMFNGHMDYFFVGSHLNNVGLRDFFGGLAYESGQWSAGFRLHIFTSDALLNNPQNPAETMPRYLGTEIDIFAGFRLFENATLRAGYSQMFASESMEVLKGGSRKEVNNWAWLMLVLRMS